MSTRGKCAARGVESYPSGTARSAAWGRPVGRGAHPGVAAVLHLLRRRLRRSGNRCFAGREGLPGTLTTMPRLALPLLDRAPRRRQARAREHAGGVPRRRGARLSHVRVRRQAVGRRRRPSCCTTATLERTTSGLGTAGERPWAALSQLDAGSWHGARHAGEAMPDAGGHRALRAGQRPARSTSRSSRRPASRRAPASWSRAPPRSCGRAARRRRCSAPSRCRRSKPRPPPRRRCRARCCWTSCGSGWFETARRLACRAVVTHHSLMDAALVQRLHGAGLRALVYTVNDAGRRSPRCARRASTASSPTRSSAIAARGARRGADRVRRSPAAPAPPRLGFGVRQRGSTRIARSSGLRQATSVSTQPARRPRTPATRAGRRARPASRRSARPAPRAAGSASAWCWSCAPASAPASPPGAARGS